MNFVRQVELAINSNKRLEIDSLLKRLVNCPNLVNQSEICQIGVLLANNSCVDMAISFLKKISLNGKKYPAITHLLGKICSANGLHQESRLYFQEALGLTGRAPQVLYDLSNAYASLGEARKAIQILTELIDKKYRLADVYFNRGNSFLALGNFHESLNDFMISNTIQADVDSINNIGFLYRKINKISQAIKVLSEGIEKFGPRRNLILNRAACFYDLKNYQSSINDLKLAISLYPEYPSLYDAIGMSYVGLMNYGEATKAFERLIELDPCYPYALGKLHSVKLKLCDWIGDQKLIDGIKSGLSSDLKVSMPFHVLGVIDDQKYQFLASKIWALEKFPIAENRIIRKNLDANRKIKIGYFSSDFYSHATMHLMEDLFKFHDLQKFEIYAFSNENISDDVVSQRVKKYFTDFFEIDVLSDSEVINLCDKLALDIAIDLKGYTQDARLSLFAKRVAPIQISYLGYPGTIGSEFMDYLIADRYVIPEFNQAFFSEKIIYLNGCYQVNSESRALKVHDAGLDIYSSLKDKETFVYASFNNQYKIRPDIFVAWMNILKAVPNAVLMIYTDNNSATDNLKLQAHDLGIMEDRLIFIGKVNQEQHIARQSQVDLCLDTFPYGGHTTCSDALGQGILYLSLCGNSFPSRVSASILNALNMPDLITYSLDEYVEKAVNLGNDKKLFKEYKAKLNEELKSSSLFNSKLFVDELESIYKKLIFSD